MAAPLLNKASFASSLTVPALRVSMLQASQPAPSRALLLTVGQCQAALGHLKHLLIKVPKVNTVLQCPSRPGLICEGKTRCNAR